jgi:hypothetical protein
VQVTIPQVESVKTYRATTRQIVDHDFVILPVLTNVVDDTFSDTEVLGVWGRYRKVGDTRW